MRPNSGTIFVLWHEHLIAGAFALKKFQPTAVVSTSKDGDLIAYTMEKIGFGTTRGSSTRGGAKALLGSRQSLKK